MMEIAAIFGWLMAGIFCVAYLTAQSKLDDYRVDREVLRNLRLMYPDDVEWVKHKMATQEKE